MRKGADAQTVSAANFEGTVVISEFVHKFQIFGCQFQKIVYQLLILLPILVICWYIFAILVNLVTHFSNMYMS